MGEVVLIGDSIRIGYQETVRKGLRGVAEVWTPAENGGDSRKVLGSLEVWATSRRPDVVHINCGLHDLKRAFDAEEPAVPLAEYRENVAAILRALCDRTEAQVIWAMTTPVNQARHHARKGFDRFEADVQAYNGAAAAVCREQGVVVNDLYEVVTAAGRDGLLLPDGVHFNGAGYRLLGEAVSRAVQEGL